MQVVAKAGREDIAQVYIARTQNGKLFEFVESLQPPLRIEKKWILMVSCLYGCPVECSFCDAGGTYKGRLSADEIIFQIKYLVGLKYPDLKVPCEKFKIQFSRMGEPSFNDAVIDVLKCLPGLLDAPGLIPSLSTIAPRGRESFFAMLLDVKKRLYKESFQLQFSIHTTDEKARDRIMPVKKLSFEEIAAYGDKFFDKGGKKITLNFAMSETLSIDPDVLLKHFDKNLFLLKLTPLNPTYSAHRNGVSSSTNLDGFKNKISDLRGSGYDVIESIGENEENLIGSNCGQYIETYNKRAEKPDGAYTYPVKML